MDIKTPIQLYKDSESLLKRSLYRCALPLWLTLQFFRNARYRAEMISHLRHGDYHFQRSVFTQPSRYPILFRECARYLANRPQPKLLSFGCATGEEVASLAEYLPEATIIGVDTNAWCLKQCCKNHPNHLFLNRFSPEFAALGDFDAIFCLAVFQRTENRTGQRSESIPGFSFHSMFKFLWGSGGDHPPQQGKGRSPWLLF